MAAPEARRRRASSLTSPRPPCRSIGLGLFLLLSLACCLIGTTPTLAASSIPPLSVFNSRRVSVRDAPPAGIAKKRHLSSLLTSCRGGAAVAEGMPVEIQKGVGPMEVFLQTIKEARRHLAAAAVARSVSIFGMCEFKVCFLFCLLDLSAASEIFLASLLQASPYVYCLFLHLLL